MWPDWRRIRYSGTFRRAKTVLSYVVHFQSSAGRGLLVDVNQTVRAQAKGRDPLLLIDGEKDEARDDARTGHVASSIPYGPTLRPADSWSIFDFWMVTRNPSGPAPDFRPSVLRSRIAAPPSHTRSTEAPEVTCDIRPAPVWPGGPSQQPFFLTFGIFRVIVGTNVQHQRAGSSCIFSDLLSMSEFRMRHPKRSNAVERMRAQNQKHSILA